MGEASEYESSADVVDKKGGRIKDKDRIVPSSVA